MTAPGTIRVRLISEEAGAIAITPVVVQEMSPRELLGHILELTGNNAVRIQRILQSGSMVSGASRFRWDGFELAGDELAKLLASFPGDEPARPFNASRCTRLVIRLADRRSVVIDRDLGARRRLLKRRSFWDDFVTAVPSDGVSYVRYSYRDEADEYELAVPGEVAAVLEQAAGLLPDAAVQQRLRQSPAVAVTFFVKRSG